MTVPPPRRARGFTLIELVVVIVLLGALAAIALPRFLNLGSDARIATVQQTEAAVRTAAELAHQAWLIRGKGVLSSTSVALGDGSPVYLWWGWPDGGACCMPAGAGIEATVSTQGLSVVYPDNARTRWQIDGAPTPAACSVTYAEATSATSGYTITTDTSGC